jgi:AraC-like DNA-binding protein
VLADFWEVAWRSSGDPFFGLYVPDPLSPNLYDVVSYAIAASDNLAVGFEKFVRFQRLIADISPITLTVDGDVIRVGRVFPAHPALRPWSEAALAAVLSRARELTGVAFDPIEVHFQHPRPEDISAHERVFRCPLFFSERTTEIVVAREIAGLPLNKADTGLSKILDRYASEMLSRMPRTTEFADRVRHVTAETLKAADPSLRTVATRMHMSARTLQRRLHLEGTSFNHVLDEVRREMAEGYLDQPQFSITEIAFLLGFSDVSSFHRAFKRWSARTPMEFRRRHAER